MQRALLLLLTLHHRGNIQSVKNGAVDECFFCLTRSQEDWDWGKNDKLLFISWTVLYMRRRGCDGLVLQGRIWGRTVEVIDILESVWSLVFCRGNVLRVKLLNYYSNILSLYARVQIISAKCYFIFIHSRLMGFVYLYCSPLFHPCIVLDLLFISVFVSFLATTVNKIIVIVKC